MNGKHDTQKSICETVLGRVLGADEARMMNPLALAYIGDCLHDVYVRTRNVVKNRKAHDLHMMSSREVNARAQAELAGRTLSLFTPEETDIYKRGRNIKPLTKPKNADVLDYKKATGFEAVIGYLYLTGQDERLRDLLGGVNAEPS